MSDPIINGEVIPTLCPRTQSTYPFYGRATGYDLISRINPGDITFIRSKQNESKYADSGPEKEKEKEFELPDEYLNEPPGEGDDLCVICLERERNTTILDCGHCIYCITCARKHVKRDIPCPSCRKPIKKGVIRIYK